MAMDQTMADAFQAGSGMNPTVLKVLIAGLTIGAFMLLFLWLIRYLWDAWQNERISTGELFFQLFMLAALVSFMIYFVQWA